MKHTLTLLFFFLLSVGNVLAVPANPRPFVVEQKDGTRLAVYLRGDEAFHFYTTGDNVPIVRHADNSFYYAAVVDNEIQCATLLAHNADSRTDEEKRYVQNNKDEIQTHLFRQWTDKRVTLSRISGKVKAVESEDKGLFIGKKKGLVILVNFADLSMSGAEPQQDFHRMFNEEGYSDNSHIGSVRDYFRDQSYGAFDLSFDVVGPFTMSREYMYYGRNNANGKDDVNVGQMVVEACRMADPYVDYKDYDWDGDGEAEQVFFIYAGYGESEGAPAYTIWPHKFSLQGCSYSDDKVDGPIVLDGTTVDTYACTCELTGYTGKKLNGMGTACHEFSHCLGLPDFYNVNYTGGFHMDAWDVMAGGSRSGPEGNGEIPCGYSAYERASLGWLNLETLTEPVRINDMPSLGEAPVAYKICNDNHADEYLILENRQNTRWFSYVKSFAGCHGLLVSHVDYSADAWDRHEVNVLKNHQRMTIVPADGSYGLASGNYYYPTEEEYRGDLFPGPANVCELTGDSHTSVGGKWFNVNSEGTYALNGPVTNIREKDGLISFYFKGGLFVPTPQVSEATGLEPDGFAFEWEVSQPVDSFNVEVQEVSTWINPLEHVLCSENFKRMKADTLTVGQTTDLSPTLNAYTETGGWRGKKVYASAEGAVVGDSVNSGYIATPLVRSAAGDVSFKMTLRRLEADTVFAALINPLNDTISIERTALDKDTVTAVCSFAELKEGSYRIAFLGRKTFAISSLTVYDGRFTAEDLSPGAIIGGLTKPLEKVVRTGLTENSLVVEGLKGCKYKFRVCALIEDVPSAWSDWKEVDLRVVNSIPSVGGDMQTPVRIYDMSGRPVSRPRSGGPYIFDFGKYKKKVLFR